MMKNEKFESINWAAKKYVTKNERQTHKTLFIVLYTHNKYVKMVFKVNAKKILKFKDN